MKRIVPAAWLFALLFLALACVGGSGPVWPPDGNDGRVPSYDLLYPDKTCHWDLDAFPLKVYIDPPSATAGLYGAQLRSAAVEAVDTWDGTIEGVPDLFEYETDESSADIFVHWESLKTDGYTIVKAYKSHLAIHRTAISDKVMDPEAVRLILGHELGHVLGLGHSLVQSDLMYSPIDPLTAKLTERDEDMVRWLYGQENYIVILTY